METASFRLELEGGYFRQFCDPVSGRDYLPQGEVAPVASVRIEGRDWAPTGMEWLRQDKVLALYYEPVGIVLEIGVVVGASHVRLELCAARPANGIELVIWGPYPTTLGATIGETVGVVQNRDYAIGIQALNAKTLGGFPVGGADVAPTHKVFAASDYSDISPALSGEQLLRGNTAVATAYGSCIQAYCRNRQGVRVVENLAQPHYQAPAWDDGGIVGSKVALFGVEARRALETIGAIETSEGLPHPQIDGEWAKTSQAATASYIITDFSEANIGEALALTQRAGLNYLYHSSPFATWGHFKLKEAAFPKGWDGFKECVRKDKEVGVQVGFHTLSNFITPDDPYVSPTPDPRLARIGSSQLTDPIDGDQQTIGLESPLFFAAETVLNTVMIDDELIQYEGLSQAAPWQLLGCERGAWNTVAVPHQGGASIVRLADHGYKVFLAGCSLGEEVARRIAAFCNYTGATQLSFDGLEGNHATGLGDYASALFTKAWYDHLEVELQGKVINDASQPGHYNWHTYSRMNWGEPWYAGFRHSQTQYRLQNQNYYRRNLMPAMLGWFALRDDTSLEDIEWLLARAAGFDAGFALATSIEFAGDQIRGDGPVHGATASTAQRDMAAILAAVRAWESARMAGAFGAELKAALQDIEREFHLEAAGEGRWDLYPVHSHKAQLEVSGAELVFDNPYTAQELHFVLGNAGEDPLEDLCLYLDGQCVFTGALVPGQVFRGSVGIGTGETPFALRWREGEGQQSLAVELRTLGPSRRLRAAGD